MTWCFRLCTLHILTLFFLVYFLFFFYFLLFCRAKALVQEATLTTYGDACRHGQCKEKTVSWCCSCSPCRHAVGEVAGHDTFHGLGRLDELGDGTGHTLGVDGQLLLEIIGGLVDDLQARRQTKSGPLRFPFHISLHWGVFRTQCTKKRAIFAECAFQCSPFTYKLVNVKTGCYSLSTGLWQQLQN